MVEEDDKDNAGRMKQKNQKQLWWWGRMRRMFLVAGIVPYGDGEKIVSSSSDDAVSQDAEKEERERERPAFSNTSHIPEYFSITFFW